MLNDVLDPNYREEERIGGGGGREEEKERRKKRGGKAVRYKQMRGRENLSSSCIFKLTPIHQVRH
jgi:hypothetical protein